MSTVTIDAEAPRETVDVGKIEVKVRDGKTEEYGNLTALADEVDNLQKKFDIAKLIFSLLGSVSGIPTVVGLVLYKENYEAYLSLIMLGSIFGLLSAVFSIIALFVDQIKTGEKVKSAHNWLNAHASKVDNFPHLLAELNGEENTDSKKSGKGKCKELVRRIQSTAASGSGFRVFRATSEVFETTIATVDHIKSGKGSCECVNKTFGIGAASVGIFFDLLSVLYFCIKLIRGKKCAEAENIRRLVKGLKKDKIANRHTI